MISLWSIIKLTAKATMRSHIFQLLLALLLLCVFMIPMTIAGDGTAYGYIQISLKYSLAVITFILSLSVIWLGCYSMSTDVESYQLHLVISKPVSRLKIWIGKWLGVLLIHLVLLLIAGMTIYFLILWQFSRKSFAPEQKARIESEVMVGRRVFRPEAPDIDTIARKMLEQRLEELKRRGDKVPEVDYKTALAEMRKVAVARFAEIQPGMSNIRAWHFSGIPDTGKPLFLRFRFYVNNVSSREQRVTRGQWFRAVEDTVDKDDGKENKEKKAYPSALGPPEQYMTGVFHEIKLLPKSVLWDNSVEVLFANLDPKDKPLILQMSDGPKLLVRATGFFGNFIRALAVSALELVILGGLACAVGGVMSMPVAIFMVFSYLLFGVFAQFLVGNGVENLEGVTGYIGYWVSRGLMVLIIPMQNFDVSSYIADGELIEFALIGTLIFKYFILRALPLFLLGIMLYRRREMGLVIRK
ncbi:MAG: hypothetical protein PHQ27_01670 [Victivallales bacterium]|nr:hypothetical protein [Victivallales bacterium]